MNPRSSRITLVLLPKQELENESADAMMPSRTFRVLFLGSMLVSMAVVMVWAGVIGWRMWPEWRAVRQMRSAVEAESDDFLVYEHHPGGVMMIRTR